MGEPHAQPHAEPHAESHRAPQTEAASAATKPVRLALVLSTSTGGIGRHVAAAAQGLRRLGRYQVAVLGPADTDRAFGFSGSRVGVRFRSVDAAAFRRPDKIVAALLRLRRLTARADIVHAHGVRAAVASALAMAGRPAARRPALVVTFHNAMLGSGIRRRAGEFAMRWVTARADAVLVVSPDLAETVRAGRPDVDRALVSSALPAPGRGAKETRLTLGLPPDCALVLAVGRLHPQKGFDVLVSAFARSPELGQRAIAVIAGEGPQRAELEATIERGGADVRLLGDRADIADLVHAADVVVMPSRWEGWPLTAAEVLGAGAPLVATRVGGLPELVADAALLVPPDDPDALAKAIDEVLRDRQLAGELATKARRRAAALPPPEAVVDQLDSCYATVLGRRR